MNGPETKGIGICHYCGAELVEFEGTFASLDPSDRPVPDHPLVGWAICSPGCPERPRPAIVVERGITK